MRIEVLALRRELSALRQACTYRNWFRTGTPTTVFCQIGDPSFGTLDQLYYGESGEAR